MIDQLPFNQLSNRNLSSYTGFASGGDAKAIYAPFDIEELQHLLLKLNDMCIKRYILGNGSNVIALDEGYDGVVVLTKNLDHISIEDNRVTCEAGVKLDELVRFTQRKSLTGLEDLYGIPGTVGGVVFMNAGAYDTEIKDLLINVTVLTKDNLFKNYTINDCLMGYRTSRFQHEQDLVILKAELILEYGDSEIISEKMRNRIQQRNESQPLNYRSCGSTFKRPIGAYAAKLIDDCGLKGLCIGDAMVSDKHAGFIVNKGNASSKDILALVVEVKRIVYEKTGFLLEPEVRVME